MTPICLDRKRMTFMQDENAEYFPVFSYQRRREQGDPDCYWQPPATMRMNAGGRGKGQKRLGS